MDNEAIKEVGMQAYEAAKELFSVVKPKEGDLFVVGCSTSEAAGEKIGSASSPDLAEAIFQGIYKAAKEQKLFVVAQCCEHLNRALILEAEAAERRGYERVNVVPRPKAGGSFATMAWKHFSHPVAVEHIKADLGMDIGDTLIGMHLKDVAVPVRIAIKNIGAARVVCARTRAKYIGGCRAEYEEEL